jgi:hypothetical protein
MFGSPDLCNWKQAFIRPVSRGHNGSGQYVDIGGPLVGILRLFGIALTVRRTRLAWLANYKALQSAHCLPFHLTVKFEKYASVSEEL